MRVEPHWADTYRARVSTGHPGECWLWRGSLDQNGYGTFQRIKGERLKAHRCSYILACGPIPPGMNVCHSCDVRACCNPAHLWLGTQKQNLADMTRKGRRVGFSLKGDAHGSTRIPDAALPVIRALRAGGAPTRIIAQTYGVSHSTIARIVKGERRA